MKQAKENDSEILLLRAASYSADAGDNQICIEQLLKLKKMVNTKAAKIIDQIIKELK